jgi:DNA primase
MKRKQLVDRAKNLLKNLLDTEIPESREISQMVRDEVKTAEIVSYGHDRLAAGPMIDKSDELIFVEGRADVVNLLKNDITNVIAIGGAKVTRTIVNLSKKKEVTLFLDGDRGGDIILNELSQGGVDIDFVARAPAGTEVEELTRKEIIKYLRNRVPFEQNGGKAKIERREAVKLREPEPRHHPQKKESREKAPEPKPEPVKVAKEDLVKELESLANTLRARFYNSNLERVSEVPVRDVIKSLSDTKDVHAIVFDGIITQRLADLASKQGVKVLVGLKIGNVNKVPEDIEIVAKNK